jgi:hypothetical protein
VPGLDPEIFSCGFPLLHAFLSRKGLFHANPMTKVGGCLGDPLKPTYIGYKMRSWTLTHLGFPARGVRSQLQVRVFQLVRPSITYKYLVWQSSRQRLRSCPSLTAQHSLSPSRSMLRRRDPPVRLNVELPGSVFAIRFNRVRSWILSAEHRITCQSKYFEMSPASCGLAKCSLLWDPLGQERLARSIHWR